MAFGVNVCLMFALMAAMAAMAVQAGSRLVSCTNEYCEPITVNGVVIGTGFTLDVLVDDGLGKLTCAVLDKLEHVVVTTCNCPSYDTAAKIVEQGTDLVLVTECVKGICPDIVLPPCILTSNPAFCLE